MTLPPARQAKKITPQFAVRTMGVKLSGLTKIKHYAVRPCFLRRDAGVVERDGLENR